MRSRHDWNQKLYGSGSARAESEAPAGFRSKPKEIKQRKKEKGEAHCLPFRPGAATRLSDWGAGHRGARTGNVGADHAGLVSEEHALSGLSRGNGCRGKGVGLVARSWCIGEGVAALGARGQD